MKDYGFNFFPLEFCLLFKQDTEQSHGADFYLITVIIRAAMYNAIEDLIF